MQNVHYPSSQVAETKYKKLLHLGGNLFEPLGEKKTEKIKQKKVQLPALIANIKQFIE